MQPYLGSPWTDSCRIWCVRVFIMFYWNMVMKMLKCWNKNLMMSHFRTLLAIALHLQPKLRRATHHTRLYDLKWAEQVWCACLSSDSNNDSITFIIFFPIQVNHLPGSFQIGRKDRLWRNLSRMQVHFGKKDYGFVPQTYCLPFDMKLLKRAWEDSNSKQKWILKPVSV